VNLAEFIEREADAIVDEWDRFARTCLPAASQMTPLELRDHAHEILHAIAVDLRTPQSREQQVVKGQGRAPVELNAAETIAQTHGVLRARNGFDIRQLVSEYRALRACVLRLASDACAPHALRMDDVMRFNEAIDQALAESVCFYSTQVERARNLLLGMLGHDMRSPLQAIRMTAAHLKAMNAGADVSNAATRLIRSGARMQSLLDGLVDFNRTQFGLGVNVSRVAGDLGEHCASGLEEVRIVCPSRTFEFSAQGDCSGLWDRQRIEQLVSNLVNNAVKYGTPDTPIQVTVTGGEGEVTIDVVNQGVLEVSGDPSQLFEPLQRGHRDNAREPASLGLGLFIAREIAQAHGGSIAVRSDSGSTVFSVRLRRSA